MDNDILKITPVAVYPKHDCPHITDNVRVSQQALAQAFTQNKCSQCNDGRENWVCLHCGTTNCSRYIAGHGAAHHEQTQHAISVSFSDLSVWCYLCESYIVSRALLPSLGALHQAKFGHVMPGDSYFVCDNCSTKIKNVRWHCSECQNYDLCNSCKDKGEFTNSKHTGHHTMSPNYDRTSPPV